MDRREPRALQRVGRDGTRFSRRLASLIAVAGLGCNSGPPLDPPDAATPAPSDAGVAAAVRPVFDLGPSPMRFGDVPWPDDAYVDGSGKVRVRGLPSEAPEFAEELASSMADLDGFGVRPTIYFRFDGEIDPRSLPAYPEDSLESRASVFLIDADTSSAQAFEQIPVDVSYEPERRELRFRPAYQRGLTPGRVYAAVVTRSVRDAEGDPIDGARRFLALRDAVVAPADPIERAARARYLPLIEALARRGLPRSQVAALAVFRVQTIEEDLSDVMDTLSKTPSSAPAITESFAVDKLDELLGSPPLGAFGLDDGAAHDHVGFLIHGRFTSPNLLSTKAAVHGAFERSASGELRIKRQDEVPFTVVLPRAIGMGTPVPIVVVQHDWLGERSDGLALANALAASGYAVVAADAPFHGLRSGLGDRTRRFTEAEAPDGFGDAAGDFAGEADTEGDLQPLHPFYYRDAVRQGVVDLVQLVKLLREGDWSALSAVDPALASLEFDTRQIGFVGIGLGADMGVMLGAFEPAVGPIVLAFPSGSTVDGWSLSAARRPLYDALLSKLGFDPGGEPVAGGTSYAPDMDLWRTLVDRADPLGYAPALHARPVDVFLLMARDDEVAHNAGTEALAFALGALQVGGVPRYELALESEALLPGANITGNVDVAGIQFTRVLYTLDRATHGALLYAHGEFGYEHPLVEPLTALGEPAEVENPIANTLRQVAFFFESSRACRTATPGEVCAASVMAPRAP